MSNREQIDVYDIQGASCKIAPGWAANLFSWVVDGRELMYCPEDYPAAAPKITGGGNPLLFPAVGRTWDRSSGEPVPGNYHIHGIDKTFFMPSHGVLYLSEFRQTGKENGSDWVSATYKARIPEKVKEENYPFDMEFVQKYTLRPDRVELETVIINKGNRTAPAAFGYHPYFRISNPQREGVEVHFPVSKHLIVTKDTVLFTGESEDTDGVFNLQPDIYYDDVHGNPNGNRMTLIDPRGGRRILVEFDDKMELFLLYSPDGSDFVCMEPWTRGLGAYEYLKDPGWQSGDLIPVYHPGELRTYRAAFIYEPL